MVQQPIARPGRLGSGSDAGLPAALTSPVGLAEAVRAGLREHADPAYVAGTVAARGPGKPVLGVRIPLLRAAVRVALRAVSLDRTRPDPELVRDAASVLWHGVTHEDELAACMLLRLAQVAPGVATLREWAPLLDNWLSVDELGGVLGASLQAGQLQVEDLVWLAGSASVWQRRLYLVAVITPVRLGLDPGAVPHLAEVLSDSAKPVRKAAVWLITAVVKARPDAAEQFRRLLPDTAPRPLTRLLGPAR